MELSADLAAATAEIGAGMKACETCPFCGGAELTLVACRNDLHAMADVDDSMKDSDYHVCLDCSLAFPRRRQSQESVTSYYHWFAHLEQRDYAVYPPPQSYIEGKAGRAAVLLDYLADHGFLSPGMAVAHIRCDVGSLLTLIGDRFPGCTLHGFDYFDSNVRYANEQGLDGVGKLDPAGINLANDAAYDLIVCNHIFTHSLEPRADLKRLYGALKPGGVLFLYNEVDHQLRFQPHGPFYQWVALNNFHKQLLSPECLLRFLVEGGLAIEAKGYRGFYLHVLARRETAPGEAGYDNALVLAARDAAPVMARNFRRWATVQESRFHGLIKVTSKLKKTLLRSF